MGKYGIALLLKFVNLIHTIQPSIMGLEISLRINKAFFFSKLGSFSV